MGAEIKTTMDWRWCEANPSDAAAEIARLHGIVRELICLNVEAETLLKSATGETP